MTPDQLINNGVALVQTLLTPGGMLAAMVGTAAYGLGKASDSPNMVRWGKNGWIGALIMWGGATIASVIQYVSGQIF